MVSELIEEIILSNRERRAPRKNGEGYSAQTNINEHMLASDWSTLQKLRLRLSQFSDPILLYEGAGHDLTPLFILPKAQAIYVDPLYNIAYTKEQAKLRLSHYPIGTNPLTVNRVTQSYLATQFKEPFERIGYNIGMGSDWPQALQKGTQLISLTDNNHRKILIYLEGHTLTEIQERLPELDIIYTNPISPTPNFLRTFGALRIGGIMIFNSLQNNFLPDHYQKLHQLGLVSEPEKFTFSARPFRHLFKEFPWLNSQPRTRNEENLWVMEKMRLNKNEADIIALENIGLTPGFERPLHLGTAI